MTLTMALTPTDFDLASLDISATDPRAALKRPIDELVSMTLDAAGRSSKTRRSYVTAVGQFLTYLDAAQGAHIPAELAADWRPFAEAKQEGRQTRWAFRPPAAVLRLVSPGVLAGFPAWLAKGAHRADGEGMSGDSASIRLYAVRSFLSVAFGEGVLTSDQATRLGLKPYRARQRRDRKPVGRRLTVQEARKLRDAPNLVTLKGKRDGALLDCLLYMGLRAEELCNLDLSNFHQDGGRWWLTLTGKGSKTRRLKLPDPVYKSLVMWLTAASLPAIGQGAAGPVFLSVNKGGAVSANPLTTGAVSRLVAEYGHAAKLAPASGPGRLSPHDLRRTCARRAYDNGAPLLKVQAMLGHSDVKTTAAYIGAYDDDAETGTDFVRY